MNILLTGGAGYIGSHATITLIENKHKVTIIDNLVTGDKKLVPKEAKLIVSDIADEKKLSKFLDQNQYDVIIHFAAYTKVGESVKFPEKYYENNFEKAKKFFNLCIKKNIKKIIYSSTGSVYGNIAKNNILETDSTSPLNPYSKSKLKTEEYLKQLSNQNLISCIVLRYFNVAGADYKLRSGLLSNPDNLIKAVCEVINGKREKLIINGNKYKTKDGTTIRDFIHVSDLAEMHNIAAKKIFKSNNTKFEIFNCGYGIGYSILDVVNEMKIISGKKLNYIFGPPRSGDAGISVANADKFKKEFDWRPKYNNLKIILKSSLEWDKKL